MAERNMGSYLADLRHDRCGREANTGPELTVRCPPSTSSIGNLSARSQFNQTRDGKQLIGGYLSRESTAQVERLRSDYQTLSVLIKLSEGTPLAADDVEVLRNRRRNFVRRSKIGYVVLDLRFDTEADAAPVVEHLGLTELQRDGDLVLYATRLSE